MRTTVDIEDDVLQIAKELAQIRGITMGQVISELVRKALAPAAHHTLRNGVPVIHRRPGTPMMTLADVKRMQEDDV